MKKKSSLLGKHSISKKSFPHLNAVFKEFEKKEFKSFNDRHRSEKVNRTLLELIQKEPEPCFLMSAVLEFVERVDDEKILHHYTFTSFEIWLNQFSHLSFEENYRIRAKIAGKWVARGDYQVLFPIGMGKVYEGTHFVTAHKSPDLDTTIASFWGWVDAFAARVGDGLHVWNLPGGPPQSQIEMDLIFRDCFGPAVFTHLPKMRGALSLSGNDLMSQKGLQRKTLSDSIGGIDHERDHNAVVIVDDQGFYLGDWRHFDVESIRQVIIQLSSCLRWFENSLHLNLITLFAKTKLHIGDIQPALARLFKMKLESCEPAHEFSSMGKKHVNDFLVEVLDLKNGLQTSFEELGVRLAKLAKLPFEATEEILDSMKKAKLFDPSGKLIEERPRIFSFLEKAIKGLHEGIIKIRTRLETLDIALKTKTDVFGHHPTYVTVRADVDEIRNKMASYPYLTVTYPDRGKLFPVGVIQATDLRKNILGTVSLRDFCNRDEMTIPNYLEVISVIDHHKTALNTFTPPTAMISDAQSSNSLVAAAAFQINDLYSLAGSSIAEIDSEIAKVSKENSPLSMRLLQRLLTRRLAANKKGSFFIHPDREFLEYLHFFYGILEDTDLLTKVTATDIECLVQLLNRMKTLQMGCESEVVHLDGLARDKNFAKLGAQRILQNEETYSLYRKVVEYRGREVENNLSLCAHGKPSNLFADTKEQNGCCRVGQTKLFAKNIPHFEKHADAVRRFWLKNAEEVRKTHPEIDLHIHMISTIVSAEEVYKGTTAKYSHSDEMWIWIPTDETATLHLKHFLNAFQASPGLKNNPMEVEFLGTNGPQLSQLFKESSVEIAQKRSKKNLPIAILRYKAGSLNSRKAMVTPFLPGPSA